MFHEVQIRLKWFYVVIVPTCWGVAWVSGSRLTSASWQGKMIMQDKLEKERNDAKNAVEECVYEFRDKLCGPYEKFICEQVRFRALLPGRPRMCSSTGPSVLVVTWVFRKQKFESRTEQRSVATSVACHSSSLHLANVCSWQTLGIKAGKTNRNP